MKTQSFLLAALAMLIPVSCTKAQPLPANSKILVAYFSHSGNTREIANQIKEATGADLFEIVPVDAYPTDYKTVVDQAKRELKAGHRPKLKTNGPSLEQYDVIFVGSPNWWGTVAPPVMTFLSSQEFAGKTIVPFITHEGSRMGNSVSDVKKLCPRATVLEGESFRGSNVKEARSDVVQWLSDLKVLRKGAPDGK